MKRILLRRTYWLLAIAAIISLFIAQSVAAQTTNIKFSTLLVEVWPEYDRAEVLVIVRGELTADVELPALLTFTLPGYIDEMHAVAIDQNGNLVDANPDSMQIVHEGDFTKLTFASTSPRMQFEYYDPVILTKTGQNRALDFAFTAPYAVDALTVEMQEPAKSTGFSLTPAPDNSFTGNNGLKFNIIELTGVAADQLITAQASYQRNTEALSVESLPPAPANTQPAAGNLSAPVGGETSSDSFFGSNSIGYILLGAGIILLLGTGGYWWWTNARLNAQPVPARRAPTSKADRRDKQARRPEPAPQPARPRSQHPPETDQSEGFCYKCGTPLRRDSNFCHKCGAERRS